MNRWGIIRKVSAGSTQPAGNAVTWRSAFLPVIFLLAALAAYPWDSTVIDTVRNSSSSRAFLDTFGKYFVCFGKGDVLVILALLLGFCGLKQRAFAIICALLMVFVLVWPLKIIIHRERPRGNSFVSFPSGDAASTASVAQVLATGLPVLAPVAAVMVAAVSAGRVMGLAHNPSDVLAGSALGIIAGIIGFEISRRYILELRQRYFFLLFALYISGNELFCLVTKTQDELFGFIRVYGPVICVVVVGRLIYLLANRRKTA